MYIQSSSPYQLGQKTHSQWRNISTAILHYWESVLPGAFLAGFPALHRRDTSWMHRIFVCGWFAWRHGWWRRPSFGLGTWSRSPLLLLFMGTSVRRNILLKDSYSSIRLAQWKVLFTFLKDYIALFHRILFHVLWVNVQVLPQYCISYPILHFSGCTKHHLRSSF